MFIEPKNDLEFSLFRLDKIMSRRRLSINPYTFSDSRLLEIAMKTGWGSPLDITEIVIMKFTRLRAASNLLGYDGIYFQRGDCEEEIFLPSGRLFHRVTANDTIKGENTTYGNKKILHPWDVEYLVGKRAFVSHVIRGVDINLRNHLAYRMHPLRGSEHNQAETIRKAMCEAKLIMLQRILDNPTSPDTLSCSRGFFDYQTRILKAMEIIRHYPETPVPEE